MTFLKDKDPTFIARMESGYVYMGYSQFLPGYCILVADPEVESLNYLGGPERAAFLADMGTLGDAILAACAPARVNYGILGNSYAALHAHLFPRYSWEPEEQKTMNVWRYPEEYWTDADKKFSAEKHGEMQGRIGDELRRLMG